MDNLTKRYLDLANLYAKQFSQCKKVQVGSVIVDDSIDNNRLISLGTNITIPFNCKACGCLREQKYGENSKLHRNPEDCRAVHSEVNAILNAKTDVTGKSIYTFQCDNPSGLCPLWCEGKNASNRSVKCNIKLCARIRLG